MISTGDNSLKRYTQNRLKGLEDPITPGLVIITRDIWGVLYSEDWREVEYIGPSCGYQVARIKELNYVPTLPKICKECGHSSFVETGITLMDSSKLSSLLAWKFKDLYSEKNINTTKILGYLDVYPFAPPEERQRIKDENKRRGFR